MLGGGGGGQVVTVHIHRRKIIMCCGSVKEAHTDSALLVSGLCCNNCVILISWMHDYGFCCSAVEIL